MKKSSLGSLALLIAVSAGMGCSKSTDTPFTGAVKLTGNVSIRPLYARLDGDAEADPVPPYSLNCLSLSNVPAAASSTIGEDGSFSLSLPPDVPLGCFIRDSSTKKACLLVVEDTDALDLDGNAVQSASISLKADASLNTTLSCDPHVGKARIQKSEIETALSSALSRFDPSTLHGNTYRTTCIPVGDAETEAKCKREHDGTLMFFRYFKGSSTSTNGAAETLAGLSVWTSPTSWSGCGSVDVSVTMVQRWNLNAANGQGAFGSWSVTKGGGCETRLFDPESRPKAAVAINRIKNVGGAWVLNDPRKYQRSDGIGGSCFLYVDDTLSMISDPAGTYDFLLSLDRIHGTDCPSVTGEFQTMKGKFVLGMKKQA